MVCCTRLWSRGDEEKVKRAGKLCRNKNASVSAGASLARGGVSGGKQPAGRRKEG